MQPKDFNKFSEILTKYVMMADGDEYPPEILKQKIEQVWTQIMEKNPQMSIEEFEKFMPQFFEQMSQKYEHMETNGAPQDVEAKMGALNNMRGY